MHDVLVAAAFGLGFGVGLAIGLGALEFIRARFRRLSTNGAPGEKRVSRGNGKHALDGPE